ncbi:MAG: MotA/TolQ/ExbB proton channel family protein [Planctomycetota bacterium]
MASAQDVGVAEAGERSLFDMLVKGGPLLAPILLASLVMMVVSLERFVALRRSAVAPGPFIKCLLSQIREGETRDGALILCEENNSHIARVFRAGIQRWGKSSVEVEQAILDEGERAANALRRNLRVINGVAQVCPLLGLLGTVVGMMAAFDAIAGDSAMGRPELLAGGIGEALLSTASGLAVAIPALILYMYFVGRVDMLVMEIDRCGQELVHLISAEALSERKASGRKKAA